MTTAIQPVTSVLSTAQKISFIGQNARQVFVDREEVIHAFECGLCCGEHILLLGPPGTSKTAISRYFSECMEMNFFYTLLNPDSVKEDIFGPISVKAMQDDRWDRKWSGLATADIALTDEIGKASNQVLNLLLKAMEERKADTPDYQYELPLHMMVSGSNETLDEDAAAVWDRFTIRVIVRYIKNAGDFARLLSVNAEEREVVPVNRQELVDLREMATRMSVNLSSEVQEKVVEIWTEISNQIPTPISDRRWKKLMRVAAGRALLEGRLEIEPEDLIVGKWILWEDISHEQQIHAWITEKVYKDQQEFQDTQALINEIYDQVMMGKVKGLQQKRDSLYRITKILRVIERKGNEARWKDLEKQAQEISDLLVQDDE